METLNRTSISVIMVSEKRPVSVAIQCHYRKICLCMIEEVRESLVGVWLFTPWMMRRVYLLFPCVCYGICVCEEDCLIPLDFPLYRCPVLCFSQYLWTDISMLSNSSREPPPAGTVRTARRKIINCSLFVCLFFCHWLFYTLTQSSEMQNFKEIRQYIQILYKIFLWN